MTWSILCLKLKDGNVSPLAKTKRDISKKEMRRLCRRFRQEEDYTGEATYSARRLGYTEDELRTLPTI